MLRGLLMLLGVCTACACPFAHRGDVRGPAAAATGSSAAVESLNWAAVQQDIAQMLVTSMAFWPSDYGTYGPLMIRQAWHCAGSYRLSDGLGGCDGARQRFEPELSWADNTNLEKAKTLLWPIKMKYGAGLSFGDLIVLTGNVAIASMGGPVLGFCGGRIDDPDGAWSLALGPTEAQRKSSPCAVNGNCSLPFGTTTIGLIYVNPEGPMGNPDPVASAPEVRDVFARMGMNDGETVALIGGGHTFGKTHGACRGGAGPSPKEDPANPWPGTCGTGKGADAYTSGFEGSWTSDPTTWDNDYFVGLTAQEWVATVGPGGRTQFNQPGNPALMMLTTDMALMADPAFEVFVDLYFRNMTAFRDDFSHAWYKLTTRDMGPATRCVGPDVPPPQPFQFPLPPPPATLANFTQVAEDILTAMGADASHILPPDTNGGRPYYGALIVHLAWQCATTFRVSDYIGGCNGARIRFAPQSEWPMNVAMDRVMAVLAPIKAKYGDTLSWADLIVLSGNVAITAAGATVPFCGGRTDAAEGYPERYLAPNGNYSATVDDMRIGAAMAGLTATEAVALSGRLRSPGQMGRVGYNGTWNSASPGTLSNAYFTTLLKEVWVPATVVGSGAVQYVAQSDPSIVMVTTDMWLRWDAEYLAVAQGFAADNALFVSTFAAAWTKVMTMDRFKGPTDNVCL